MFHIVAGVLEGAGQAALVARKLLYRFCTKTLFLVTLATLLAL